MAVSALRQRKKNLKPCPELVDHYKDQSAINELGGLEMPDFDLESIVAA
jgi:hypothetical protein